MTVDTVEQAIDVLQAQVQPGDVVLVKASRAVGLERVAGAAGGEAMAKLVVIAGLISFGSDAAWYAASDPLPRATRLLASDPDVDRRDSLP